MMKHWDQSLGPDSVKLKAVQVLISGFCLQAFVVTVVLVVCYKVSLPPMQRGGWSILPCKA